MDLKDKRLDDRMQIVLDQLGAMPTASIPAACGGNAEMTAAYRFFDNPKVDFGNVLEPHMEATHRRIAEYDLVLLVQDTTEIVLDRPRSCVEGAGLLDDSRRGFFLHPTVAFTPDGTPLGVVFAEAWTRSDERIPNTKKTRSQRARTPIEEKESIRWGEAYQQACDVARQHPQTQFLCVADSEADIYELFEATQRGPENLHWLVRSGQDRALEKNGEETETARHLRETVQQQEVLFTHEVKVRGRQAKISSETRGRKQPRIPDGRSRGACRLRDISPAMAVRSQTGTGRGPCGACQ
ncbi:MAG: transposase [Planctomycetaceae bacterium]|nr:transposase [Planctomycetaceae bacterium]